MIKAILSDLVGIILLPRPGSFRYDPVGFNLHDSCEINYDYLEILARCNLPLFVLTNFQNASLDPILRDILNQYNIKLFEAGQLGLDKASSYAYEFIAKNKLGLKPELLLFIDDTPSNIEAAAKTGALSVLYTSNAQISKFLTTINV